VTLVIDASVATKWVLPEIGSDLAAALRHQDDDLIAPALIAGEVGNAIWKRVMWRELSQDDAVRAVDIAVSLVSRLIPMEELASRALQMAIELQHPIYDCFYLALAERERVALVCADGPLVKKAKKLKSVKVRAL
jgi:predicted nucleic acid-binding protein